MSLVTVGAIAGIVLVFILLMAVAASRYKKAGPNQAFILTGRGGQKVIAGGGVFVMPVIQKLWPLDLSANKVEVHRDNIFTKNRIPINVDAVLVFKVNSEIGKIKLAAESLYGKSPKDISDLVEKVAEGAFRAICGKMTPEEINEDREKFQNEVTTNAQGHFNTMGMDLISFVVTHISDEQDYFKNLGVPASAEVGKEARVKQAEANKSAIVVEAEQNLAGKKKQAETEADIALAQKERDVKKATYNAAVAEENAKAEQAGPKASAVAQQGVVEEQRKLAEKQAEKREKELLTEQVRPAEAERDAKIARAEGEKQAAIKKGEGEGEAAKKKGEGEAAGILAKLLAEADGLKRKAESMKAFNDATMSLQVMTLIIEKLPDIVRAAATPITAIDKMQIIDFGSNGAGGEGSGPLAKLLSIPPEVIAKTDASLKAVLGFGLPEFIELIRKGGIIPGLTGATTKSAVEEKKIITASEAK